jgi:hypothetical protein
MGFSENDVFVQFGKGQKSLSSFRIGTMPST